MKIQADLSICTFIRKPSSTLRELFRSFSRAADPVSIEVIVVDMSEGFAREVLVDFPEVILYENPGRENAAQAWNRAMGLATGRYLSIWGHNVYPETECFTKIVSFMEDNPDVGVAGPQILNASGKPEPTCRTFPSLATLISQYSVLGQSKLAKLILSENNPDDFEYNTNREVDWLRSGAHVIRRELFEEIGYFDESLGLFFTETDYYKRSRKAGWHNFYCCEAKALHASPDQYHQLLFNTALFGKILINYLKYLRTIWLRRSK